VTILIGYLLVDLLLSAAVLFKSFYSQLKFNSKKFAKVLWTGEKGKTMEKGFELTASYDLKIGDVIRVSKHDACPRDMLVLTTSDRKQNESFVMVDESALGDKLKSCKKLALEKVFCKNSIEEINDFKRYVKSLNLEIEFDNKV
jgi:magnesium-transporting ATPase (P-type)